MKLAQIYEVQDDIMGNYLNLSTRERDVNIKTRKTDQTCP